MERVIYWTGIISAVIAFLRLPRLIVRWSIARQLYGGIPWSLVWQLRWYLRGSRMGSLVVLTMVNGYVMLVLLARQFIRDDPPFALIFAGGAFSLLLVVSAEALLPPSILLLSSSNAAANRSLADLNAALPWHRTVALLRPMEQLQPLDARRFFFNNLRTSNGYEWRSVVFHLMDVVPLIVIDAEEGTEPVREEQSRILRLDYIDRTLVVSPGAAAPPSAHALPAQTVDREELASSARERLLSVDDQTRRQARQRMFSEMLAAIHKRVRYATKLEMLVIKCRLVESYEKERFIRACKGISPEEVGGRLFEYIPSCMTREQERDFLRTGRGWEEVESMLTGIGESIANQEGDIAEFNRGNVDNSLGAVARMQCRWEDAIRHINEAIRRLEPLTAVELVAADARRELATAHFNLAAVYAAKHFDDRQTADLQQAIAHAEKSLAIESEAGLDITTTRQLLAQIRSHGEERQQS